MKLTTILKTYFISVSILAHCLLIVFSVHFIYERVTSHWRWPIVKRWVLGDIDKTAVFPMNYNDFESLPSGRWLKIHQQRPEDRVNFVRQKHAGSAFDQLRSRIMLFGSDTHGKNWNNTIYSFDLNTLQWNEAYPNDLPLTYTVNTKGMPVAGVKANHPWAMGVFGAVTYDQLSDSLLVASYPAHLAPDKYGQSLSSVWKRIKKHPTWEYDLKTKKWNAFDGKSIHFFSHAVTYDSDKNIVTGFLPNGIYDWNGMENGWRKVGGKSTKQFHTNVVYDSVNHIFILYGGNAMQNQVYSYVSGEKSTEKMPTDGIRPPAGNSIPLAFHKKSGKVVALVDTADYAQTWLYDYATDKWQHIKV